MLFIPCFDYACFAKRLLYLNDRRYSCYCILFIKSGSSKKRLQHNLEDWQWIIRTLHILNRKLLNVYLLFHRAQPNCCFQNIIQLCILVCVVRSYFGVVLFWKRKKETCFFLNYMMLIKIGRCLYMKGKTYNWFFKLPTFIWWQISVPELNFSLSMIKKEKKMCDLIVMAN